MSFDVSAAISFLKRQYDPALGLLRASPNTEPNAYYLNNDNYLASKILAGTDIGTTITKNLAKSGIAKISTIDGAVLPNVLLGNQTITLQSIGEKTIMTEITQTSGNALTIDKYADVAFYNVLNLFNNGSVASARSAFAVAESTFWDRCGFNDIIFKTTGLYNLYKNCLYLIAADRLGVQATWRTACEARIVAAQTFALNRLGQLQNQRGGCLTEYDVNYTPTGDANVETTSLAIRCFMHH